MDIKKLVQRTIIGIAITLLLLYYLLNQVSVEVLLAHFANLSIPLIAVAFLFYLLSTIFRAYRFKFLLLDKVSLKNTFNITSIQNFLNMILPFRIGELSYIYYMKTGERISVPRSAASLILSRLLDMALVFLLLVITLLNLDASSQLSRFNNLVVIAFLLLAIAAIMIWKKEKIIGLLIKMIHAGAKKKDAGSRKAYLIAKAREFFNAAGGVSNRNLFLSLVFTILIWLTRFFFFYFSMIAVGFSFQIWPFMLAFVFIMSANLLPLPTIGDFGTSEGAWALGLMAFGISKEAAILSGFAVHIIYFVFNALFGIFGFLLFKAKHKIDWSNILSQKKSSRKKEKNAGQKKHS